MQEFVIARRSVDNAEAATRLTLNVERIQYTGLVRGVQPSPVPLRPAGLRRLDQAERDEARLAMRSIQPEPSQPDHVRALVEAHGGGAPARDFLGVQTRAAARVEYPQAGYVAEKIQHRGPVSRAPARNT